MSPSSKRSGESPPPPRRRAETPAPVETDGAPAPTTATPAAAAPQPAYDYEAAPDVLYSRIGAWAGIAYALVGFVGSSLLPVGKVDPTNTADQIAAQLVEKRGVVSAGILVTLFSLFFLTVFVSWLYRWLRDAEGEGGWFSTMALIGGVLQVAMLSIVVMLSIGSTVLADYGPDPVIARTLFVLQWQAIAIVFMPTAAFVGGASLVGYVSGQLPRWICYVGMGIGVGLLVPPIAYLPFILSNLWTGLLAVFLLQRTRGRA